MVSNDFKFELGRHQISKISREKIIDELERVSKHFNYSDFTQDDFDEIAEVNSYTIYRELGSWQTVMEFLKEHFRNKGIDFTITTRRTSYSEQEMFDEMERIWRLLGHRPSRNEWVNTEPRISYDTLYRQFGGWTNACLKFIEYKSGKEIVLEEKVPKKSDNHLAKSSDIVKAQVTTKKTRTISLGVRVKVLSRDKFRCVFCGKSPAIDVGTVLHIDHIIPFSEGGENTLSNLQTLCQDCNLGKSNRIGINLLT